MNLRILGFLHPCFVGIIMAFCFVKGCHNKRNKKKSSVSFFAFPPNPLLRKKWQWAIGRLDWEPQSYSRVCSAHFRAEQLIKVGNQTRIKDDACPINSLPIEKVVPEDICRICLATDVKIYSVKSEALKLYIDSIPGFIENFSDDMAQGVCYECAVQLKKCWLLVKKCKTSTKILLDLSTQTSQMDRSLLNICREYTELKPLHTSHEITPMSVYNFSYDHERNISVLTNKEFIHVTEEKDDDIRYIPNIWRCIPNTYENIALNEENTQINSEVLISDSDTELNTNNHEQEEEVYVLGMNNNMNADFPNFDPIDVPADPDISPIIKVNPEDIENPKVTICDFVTDKKRIGRPPRKPKRKPGERRKPLRINGLTAGEIIIEKYFHIVQLNTLQEQIYDWKRITRICQERENVIQCDVCLKHFASREAFTRHIVRHDPKRGNIECPICKIRLKDEKSVNRHRHYTHSRRFHCRSCPKVYRSLENAKCHQQFHSGRKHKCNHCSFSTMYKSTLYLHIQRSHSQTSCEICGKSCVNTQSMSLHRTLAHFDYIEPEGGEVYPCDDCNLKFKSEKARRVHLRTSTRHRDVSCNDRTPRRYTCQECGSLFQSLSELLLHKKAMSHSEQRTVKIPVKIPVKCKYCDDMLLSRLQYTWHMRREHPAHMSEDEAMVGAVCEICGLEFRNITSLRIHERRHSPRERCEQCGRIFCDKSTLARHYQVIHRREQLYSCDVCARSFNFKGNLVRHMRIHTGVKPYKCLICGKKFRQNCTRKLHVRTVHLKMPHPHRKKRKPKTSKITDTSH